jgi:biotin operon repressor
MSWAAQKWAIEQDAGDPTAKLLLVVLASYAAADNSCFPSQETLARKVECSERSIRGHLAKLESLGLIRRHERRKQGGYKLSDLIVLCMTQSDEQLDLGAVEILPAKSAGEKSHRQSASFSPATSDNFTGRFCRYIDDEPIIEPITEPSCVNGCDFEELLAAYVPFAPADNRASAVGVWKTLNPDEQAAAVRYAKAFCKAIKGEPPYLVVYLRERRWLALPGSAKALAVEYVYPGTPRWDEVRKLTGKTDKTMFLSRGPDGRECFAYYSARTRAEAR